MTKQQPLVELQGISKSFGSVQANKNISLSIRPGVIKSLLGENGAGKSTLMSILAGKLQPDEGQIIVDGQPAVFSSTKDALDAGIGMVYQHFMLVEAMTVTENIFLGHEDSFILHPQEMEQRVENIARKYGLNIDPRAKVGNLSMGEKQRVEIIKVLERKSRILIFDEPTAVLTPQETAQLFDAIWSMAVQGKAIVFISHKLAEVIALSDEIAILRKGQIVDDMSAEDITSKEDLARRMVGREVVLQIEHEPELLGDTVLDIKDLGSDVLQNISFKINQGEILGIVGVGGNGQKPLVETICGLRQPGRGRVSILGKNWKEFWDSYRWDGTLCYIPEDRLGLATCPTLDLVDNFLLTTREGFVRGPWLSGEKAAQKARDIVHSFDVQPLDATRLAGQLSGGNLQKMVIGREFYRNPKLIVAEQPTQGLDISATEDVWKHLLEIRKQAGILLVTGDLNEALALSDKIAVMFEGRIMDIFSVNDQEKVDQIGLLMAGVEPGAEPR